MLQTLTIAHHDAPFVFESGETLPHVTIAYETWGTLSPARDNVILICHALTGESHVTQHHPDDAPGWWQDAVGPGKPFDTERYFILCPNVLGGCNGSTGPNSTDPLTGRPYDLAFPTLTIRDMARAHLRLLDALGIERLKLVVGGSMGGMQALELSLLAPDRVENVAVIAAPAYTSPQSIAWNEIGRQAILMDRSQGLAVARMIGMVTYNSYESMWLKFNRDRVEPGIDLVAQRMGRYQTQLPPDHRFSFQFQVESYLHYQGEKLIRRFTPESYLYLSRAMDLHDIGEGRGGAIDALRAAKARYLFIGITTDILYPSFEQKELHELARKAGVRSRYLELDSPWGHDAFLIEAERFADAVRRFMHDTEP